VTGWAGVLGRLHPAVLHLPIGLLVALAAIEAVAAVRRIEMPRPIVTTLVWLTAGAAAFTAASGYLLSLEGGYEAGAVDTHMRLGLGVAAASLALALLYAARFRAAKRGVLRVTRWRAAYRANLLVALALLLPAGHYGSALTRGADWLLAPLRERAGPPPSGSAYASAIAPILAARCTGCHGGERRKGGLDLRTPASIAAGGKDGPVLAPGETGRSELVRRISLPEDDDDHMPPSGKPQLDPAQIAALSAWVAAGAPFDGQ